MPTIRGEELKRFLSHVYLASGAPIETARVVAELQVESDLVGHASHGSMNTPAYIEAIERGHVRPDAVPAVLSETPNSAVVDGAWGFGFSTTLWATRLAARKCHDVGVAMMTVRRQGHIGRLGAYTTRLAQEGLVALLTADSGAAPKSALPFGGREPRLGTNPISIAFPGIKYTVCVDMATTAVAVGKVRVASSRGESIPLGWILDASGAPSARPEDYFEGGGLLPLGGDQAHKGYALSAAIEIFSGLLTGIGFGVDPSGRHNDGCFLLAFNAELFRPLDEFARDVDDFVEYLKATPPAAGFEEVMYPGELEARTRSAREAHGIPLDESTVSALKGVAARLEVAPPTFLQ
jgi:uncharacterized oxidoreductase